MIKNLKKSNILTINVKSFSYNVLKFYIATFFLIVKSKKIKFKVQPIHYKKLTVLRSPHKYKKSQEHFQLKRYKSTIIIKDINISELLILLNNKPQGVVLNIKIKQNLIN